MADQNTVVTTQGWLSRLTSSIKNVFIGIILILVSIGLLFWNEGRAVKRAQTLEEGSGAVVSVAADQVSPANEGKLVHFSGMATTPQTVNDPEFGISVNALRLERKVEMYQWEEKSSSSEKKNVGGSATTTTTYTYNKTWSDRLISSGSFNQVADHQNPSSMPYPSQTFTAQAVTVGGFLLTESLLNKIGGAEKLKEEYRGASAANPQIGDVRITFSVVKPQMVSIIAKQTGNTLAPYQTSNGEPLELLEAGTKDAAAMFKSAVSSNQTMTWILRFVGWLLMFFGFATILKPLVVVADVIPFLGNLLQKGVSLLSFVIATPISLLVIAVAWIFYRPLIGIILLVVGALIVAGGVAAALSLRKKPAA